MGSNATALQTTTAPAERSVPRFLSLVSPNAKHLDPKLKPFAELALREIQSDLRPASRAEFAAALLPGLALVSPTGMTEADRQEWLKAAWIALDGIPLDLLKIGCIGARYSDHPAKIVPAILREVEGMWKQRKASRSDILAAITKMETPPLPTEERCTPEQAAEIIKRAGLKLDPDHRERSADYIPVEQRPAPTAEDYKRWGIDPQSEAA
jgi:hypothetical protein